MVARVLKVEWEGYLSAIRLWANSHFGFTLSFLIKLIGRAGSGDSEPSLSYAVLGSGCIGNLLGLVIHSLLLMCLCSTNACP